MRDVSASELRFQTELDIARGSRRGDRSKVAGTRIGVHAAEIGVVQAIEHVRLKANLEPFLRSEFLANGEVPKEQRWRRDNAHPGVATTDIGSGSKRSRIEIAGDGALVGGQRYGTSTVVRAAPSDRSCAGHCRVRTGLEPVD